MFPIGSKILCHGYVIIDKSLFVNILIINSVFLSWLCHYRLPPVFNFQAGMFFVPIYNHTIDTNDW